MFITVFDIFSYVLLHVPFTNHLNKHKWQVATCIYKRNGVQLRQKQHVAYLMICLMYITQWLCKPYLILLCRVPCPAVCLYLHKGTHMHAHTRTHIRTHIHTCTRTNTYTCTHAHMHTTHSPNTRTLECCHIRAGVRPWAQLSSSSPAPGTCRYEEVLDCAGL